MRQPVVPAELQEYRDALKAYDLAVAKWFGLDADKVFKIGVDDSDARGSRTRPGEVRVSWEATEELRPLIGRELPGGISWDGEASTFLGEVVLSYPEVEVFLDEVGEQPKFPQPEVVVQPRRLCEPAAGAGAWLIYDYDHGPYAIALHDSAEVAAREAARQGYGKVGFWPFGTELADAVNAWEGL